MYCKIGKNGLVKSPLKSKISFLVRRFPCASDVNRVWALKKIYKEISIKKERISNCNFSFTIAEREEFSWVFHENALKSSLLAILASFELKWEIKAQKIKFFISMIRARVLFTFHCCFLLCPLTFFTDGCGWMGRDENSLNSEHSKKEFENKISSIPRMAEKIVLKMFNKRFSLFSLYFHIVSQQQISHIINIFTLCVCSSSSFVDAIWDMWSWFLF